MVLPEVGRRPVICGEAAEAGPIETEREKTKYLMSVKVKKNIHLKINDAAI